jgi:hypothetical protein
MENLKHKTNVIWRTERELRSSQQTCSLQLLLGNLFGLLIGEVFALQGKERIADGMGGPLHRPARFTPQHRRQTLREQIKHLARSEQRLAGDIECHRLLHEAPQSIAHAWGQIARILHGSEQRRTLIRRRFWHRRRRQTFGNRLGQQRFFYERLIGEQYRFRHHNSPEDDRFVT